MRICSVKSNWILGSQTHSYKCRATSSAVLCSQIYTFHLKTVLKRFLIFVFFPVSNEVCGSLQAAEHGRDVNTTLCYPALFTGFETMVVVGLVIFLTVVNAYQVSRSPRVALKTLGLILVFRNEDLARSWDHQLDTLKVRLLST